MTRRWSATAWLAASLLMGVALLVLVVPLLPGYDPYAQDLMAGLTPPFGALDSGKISLLGTDQLGRDMLSRLALAGRVSIFIGLTAVSMSLVIGVTLGLLAGFYGGILGNAIMGIADLQLSIPRVLLLIAVTSLLGSTVFNLTLLLGITSWVAYGRVARAMALTVREREFVLSAVTQGATPDGEPLFFLFGAVSYAQRVASETPAERFLPLPQGFPVQKLM